MDGKRWDAKEVVGCEDVGGQICGMRKGIAKSKASRKVSLLSEKCVARLECIAMDPPLVGPP